MGKTKELLKKSVKKVAGLSVLVMVALFLFTGLALQAEAATAKITANWYPVRKLLLKGEMYNYWQKSNDSRYKDISLPFLDFRMEYELENQTICSSEECA